ncbi:MBL fold metallo-hydrolase [Roseovarius ramblicola]|uniref:MBL fold metallo-hydrolase n=1 Tax=Roseovarius ramblicola TaxID=2022336 RepID=A0ABV5I063_9RHOB
MRITRRDIMTGGLAALATGQAMQAFAATEMALGPAQLTTLSDGNLVLPLDFLIGDLPQAQATEALAQHGITGDTLTPPCNLTLYRDGTNTVLFDAGSGPAFMPSAGKLRDALDAAGVAPDEVTHVLFTHAHPDHLWGVLDDFDDPVFANAAHMIGQAEHAYWTDPATVGTIGEARASFAVGAARRLEAIADRLETFTPGQEVLPGILAHDTRGHTPGHVSFEIGQGNSAVMVVGDAIGNGHLALAHPGWASGADQNAEQGIATRLRLLDRLATEGMPMVGFHLPGGGLGRVERAGDAYRFVTEV